ncbi:2Fe-2S iron-sulfur cluster-binding protein, partial [Klebsiella pneumoniae]|uniref:2Fe-2S iron-sulfur cluster-binding protein n=1 Tax=Klebsiella pneumoniae TaxID=573 RepID=UPI003530D752
EWVHVQLHQQKGMISLSPPTICNSALESNKVPVTVACRAGVCGCCKTKVVSGKYSVTSTMTLTDAEIADGYVLACSCHPQSDLVLA